MKLTKIRLKNFRCFEDYEISFAKNTTVLIGKNGTGKSNLISALRKGLSFIFAKNKEFKNNLYNSSNSNIRGLSFWDARFNELERTFNYPISLQFSGVFLNEPLHWELYKDSNLGKFHSTKYKEAQGKILNIYNDNVQNFKLPILAFYSDSYPHVLSNVGKVAKKLIFKDVIPRDFGYYGWDDSTNCIDLWQIRYKKISNYITNQHVERTRVENQIEKNSLTSEELVFLNKRLETIKNDKKVIEFEAELGYINKKLITLTEPVRDELRFINKEFKINQILANKPSEDSINSLEFVFDNNQSIFFEMLPQGYKRLFSIALDLAYRNYFLNKSVDAEGVAFIDEIELHLHPSLQQEVLQRLTKTFPKVQFIVTTHSPLVISNLKADGENNKIIKLENEGSKFFNSDVPNVYGIDYTTNLTEVMDSNYRPSTIDKYINAYLFLLDKKKEDDANQMLQKLTEYLGGSIPKLLQEEIDNQKKTHF